MSLNANKRKFIFDHDGGIDDLISLLLLLRLPDVEVVGILITPADCYPDDALTSTLKILTLTGNTHIPVAVGNCIGPNPFPPDWRAQPRICHALPAMLRVRETRDNVTKLPAHEWLKAFLESTDVPVSVIMTGPASNLAAVIGHTAALPVEEVIWMGGAIDVKGNVAMHDHNGTAEWNAYWDPCATKTLIESDLDLTLVPLDATNALPVNRAFLARLAFDATPVSDLAGQFWAATVTAIPAYEFTYFLWDVLSVCAIALPDDVKTVKQGPLSVNTQSPCAGQIVHDQAHGTATRWLASVNADYVIAMVIHYLRGDFAKKPVPFVKSML